MGVALYRKGTTHNVRGVVCEMCVFPNEQLDDKLEEGWATSPAKAYRKDNKSLNIKMDMLRDTIDSGSRNEDDLANLKTHLEYLQSLELKEEDFHDKLPQAHVVLTRGIDDLVDRIETMEDKLRVRAEKAEKEEVFEEGTLETFDWLDEVNKGKEEDIY